jgi:hypothetical protein
VIGRRIPRGPLLVATVVMAVDQLTKAWVIGQVPFGQTREVIPGVLQIARIESYGQRPPSLQVSWHIDEITAGRPHHDQQWLGHCGRDREIGRREGSLAIRDAPRDPIAD